MVPLSDPIVGIDLGTSNSVVAYADRDGGVQVLEDEAGYKIHPSVVSFHPQGGVVVGAAAKQRKVIDPQNTIYSVKRLIGRGFRSPEVQTARSRAPFTIKEGAGQLPMIVTRGGEFAVPEISAIVLDHMRNIAAARLGTAVSRAVVTVPASFGDAQRSATATAGAIAGLTVVRVLNEPTAAALAYGHQRDLRDIIAVYDFGGGTFDISILKLEDQVYEVLGTAGNTFLGGDDLDERLVDRMVTKFLEENRIDLRTNEVSMMRLRAVAEQTKIELSRRSRAVVQIDEIAYGPRGAPLNLKIHITRDEFVQQIGDLVDRTFPVCQEALTLAGLTVEQIGDVILVGGTTKIPYVRDQVQRFFGRAPRGDVNPEDAVAVGAALQGAALEKILARPRPTTARVPAVAGPPSDPIPGGAAPPARPAAPEDEPTVPREPAAEETTSTSADAIELTDDISGATMAPSDLLVTSAPPRRLGTAAGVAAPARALGADAPAKPDTSYSVTRGRPRDDAGRPDSTADTRTRPLVGIFDEVTPPPGAGGGRAVGRMARPGTPLAPPPPPAPPPVPPGAIRTLAGVPRGPGLDPAPPVELAGEAIPEPIGRTGTTRVQLPPRPPARPPASSSSTMSIPALQPHRAPGPGAEAGGPPPGAPRGIDRDLPAATSGEITVESAPHRGGPAPAGAARGAPSHRPPPEPAPAVTAQVPSLGAAAREVPVAPPGARTLLAADAAEADPGLFELELGVSPMMMAADAAPHPAPDPPSGAVPLTGPVLAAPALPATHAAPATGAPAAALAYAPAPPPASGRPPVILEITPRGLGIATVAGYCEELIRRNSRLPAAMKRVFTTSRDRQDLVRIVICQGESRRLEQNVVIGDLVLAGLPPRPRGETAIEVMFALDASGILQVRARDAQTGSEQAASLDLLGNIAQQDVAASRDRIQQLRR